MLTCREFADFLWKYREGELPADQRLRFDAHLSVCPPCVAYLHTYEQAVRLGKRSFDALDEPVPEVPEDLVQAVLEARDRGQ